MAREKHFNNYTYCSTAEQRERLHSEFITQVRNHGGYKLNHSRVIQSLTDLTLDLIPHINFSKIKNQETLIRELNIAQLQKFKQDPSLIVHLRRTKRRSLSEES